MLYGPDGLQLRTTAPLTAAVIQALSDGETFVRHGARVLASAHLEPYCLRCQAAGVDATVRLVGRPHKTDFTCQHRAGWIIKGAHPDLQPLFSELGWSVRCTRCRNEVQGDNSQNSPTFTLTCACTLRTLDNPLARSAAAPVGAYPVDGVGRA